MTGAVEVLGIPAAAAGRARLGIGQRHHLPAERPGGGAGMVRGAHLHPVGAECQRPGGEYATGGQRLPRRGVDPVGDGGDAVGLGIVRRGDLELFLVRAGAGLGRAVDEAAGGRPPGGVPGHLGGGGGGHRGVHDLEGERGRVGLDHLPGGDGHTQAAAGVGVADDVAGGGVRRCGAVRGGNAGAGGSGACPPAVAHLEAEHPVSRRQRRMVPGQPLGGDHRAVAKRAVDPQRPGGGGSPDLAGRRRGAARDCEQEHSQRGHGRAHHDSTQHPRDDTERQEVSLARVTVTVRAVVPR